MTAWREQVTRAAEDPRLQQRLSQQEREILRRFAAQYTQLKALPRRARRAMQRRWKQSLAGVALLLALGQTPALAATINVGGACTLVDAITAANTNIATGGCPKGSGADTIVLPANSTQTLTAVNNDLFGPNGLPVITSRITVNGNGATIRRANTADDFRIFFVDQGANLSLTNTNVSNGALYASGGAMLNLGNVTLTNSTISGNLAADSAGGGVSNGGTLTLINSTISGNFTGSGSSAGEGGGVYNSGTVSLINSTISDNDSAGRGGGVFNEDTGKLTVTNSIISGNQSGGPFGEAGGGLFNYGAATLTNSTVSGNRTQYLGGGIYNGPGGSLTVTHSTISGNTAGDISGDIYYIGSGGGIASRYGDLTLRRTLISGNNAIEGREIDFQGGTRTANDFNVFGFSNSPGIDGFSPGAKDIVPSQFLTAVLNITLANNGGPTKTHALVSGSSAANAVGSGCPPPAKDQRGITRPQGARCDVGAFELEVGGQSPPDGSCAGKVTTIMGTELRDILRGTNRADVIQGLGGNDTINGLNGNDTICGGLGNDNVNGGVGNDALFGDGGNDQLFGANGNDRMTGGTGRDVCNGGPPPRGDTANSCERIPNVP